MSLSLFPASSSVAAVRSLQEQLCEPKSSWGVTPLTWGPEEEPGHCSLLSCLPLLLLACGGDQGGMLSSYCPATWAQSTCAQVWLLLCHQAHLPLLRAPCPSQPTVTDKGQVEGVDMAASTKEHSPEPQEALCPERTLLSASLQPCADLGTHIHP